MCRHVSIWGFQNRVRLSICTQIKEITIALSIINISPTLVIDTSMERSVRVLHHGNPKIWFFFKKSSKFEFWLVIKNWNHLSFVNISPTLVIDGLIHQCKGLHKYHLQHRSPKIKILFQKSWKLNFDFCSRAEISKSPYLCQYQSYIVNWYISGNVFMSSYLLQHGNPKMWIS